LLHRSPHQRFPLLVAFCLSLILTPAILTRPALARPAEAPISYPMLFLPLISRPVPPTPTPTDTLRPTKLPTGRPTVRPTIGDRLAREANAPISLPMLFLPLVCRPVPPTPTPTSTATPRPPCVVVDPSCCQVDAPNDDHDNLTEEYVCFRNTGDSAANMTGWHVRDEDQKTYTFPTFSLAPQALVRLRTGSGTDTTTDLYWGQGRAVWNNTRDTIYLYDAGWKLVDEYSYPAPRP